MPDQNDHLFGFYSYLHWTVISTYRNIITCILLIFLSLQVSQGHAQKRDSVNAVHPRNNTISLLVSFHDFFATTLPTKSRVATFLFIPTLGLQYARQLTEKDGVVISGKFYGRQRFYYINTEPPCTRDAQVLRRQVTFLDVDYARRLYARHGKLIFGTIGIGFRYGYERLVSCIPKSFEPEYFPLRDVGISVGIRGVAPIGKRFQLSSDLKFTEFVYRYYHIFDSFYTNFARHGTTRRMVALQIGIGYRF